MPQISSSWPENCPPPDSQDPGGIFYRRVRRYRALTNNDFQSQREKDRMPNLEPCLREAVSLFGSLKAVQHAGKMQPGLGKFIATGYLGVGNGKIKFVPTQLYPKNHYAWWPPAGQARAQCFSLMK